MNSRTNRVAAFLLAICMLAGNLLSYPFYRFALNEIRKEMQSEVLNIRSGDEVNSVLQLSSAEYKAASVECSELCVKDQWYDVVSVSNNSNGTVTVKCLADSKESLLHAWMKDQHSDNNVPAGKGKHSNLSLAFDVFISEQNSSGLNNYYSSTVLNCITNDHLIIGHSSSPDLPPRLV